MSNTLAARGLEEPRNSEELLIESVGPVSLFCVLCHIVPLFIYFVIIRTSTSNFTYGEVTVFPYLQTHRLTDRWTDDLGGAG